MPRSTVQIINESALNGERIKSAVSALQLQVDRDFAPIWGVSCDLEFVERRQHLSPESWWIVFLNNSNQAGALGYHDLTKSGLPMGKILMEPITSTGSSWTNTLSHELLEMLVDPDDNLVAYRQLSNKKLVLHAYEVCDPCQDDSYGYKVKDVLVSDFVHPAWFESFHKEGARIYDQCKYVKKPFELLPGGYIPIFDAASGKGWHQRDGPALHRPGGRVLPCSRAEVRKSSRVAWKKATLRRETSG